MIEKNDKFANFLNRLNIFSIIFSLILGGFVYLDFFIFHHFRYIFDFSLITGIGVFFLFTGVSTYIYYLYLLLRLLNKKKDCINSEYWEVSYIEIENEGIFEKYYPVFENIAGREMMSKYQFPKDSFAVGEQVELLWNMERTEYIFTKFNYVGQFISLILAALFMSWLGFSFFINIHTFLFVLFLIIITLIIFLLDTIKILISR